MPLLKIQTNTAIDTNKTAPLLKTVSQRIAAALNKPEQYMMVSLEYGLPIVFAGTANPAAFAELRGIGLPVSKTGELSRLICELIESELGVPRQRIYINFTDNAACGGPLLGSSSARLRASRGPLSATWSG